MYKIVVRKTAEKELSRVEKTQRSRIERTILSLSLNPYLGKPLKGEFQGIYSLKVWPFRILYEIYKKQLIIHIIKISHRQNVYK